MICLGYGYWQERNTAYKCKGGQYNVKASSIYRGNFQVAISWLLINIFRQCFKGMYVRRCTCGSQCGSLQWFGLGQLGGVSGIHMSGNYFGLGGVLDWNLVEWWGVSQTTIVFKDMCVCLLEYLYMRYEWRVQVSGHYFIGSAMLLLVLGYYSFVGSS